MTSEDLAPREASLEARVPLSTYRFQLNAAFTFRDAARLVPYLEALGIDDAYTSSYLAARPGSPHGYDLVDHNRLNPEIGSPEEHAAFTGALRARGLGHLLDVVPNHVGIAQGANRWWNDVLENGPSSPYADFFDIDWEPVERHLAQKVLLPILGDQYGRVLENQELMLEMDAGGFRVRYHDTLLPVEPRSSALVLGARLEALVAALGEDHPDAQEHQSIITALENLPPPTERAPARVRERLREKEVIRRRLARLAEASEAVGASLEETLRVFNGRRGEPRSFDLLDRLLGEQPYRLAHWRVAAEEINYRRFFDVNELAAIRMEHPLVFRETHRLILGLVEEGKVTGLRIDHPDGLFDPHDYFLAIQRERFVQVERARRREGAAEGQDLEGTVAAAAAAVEAACPPDPARPGCRPLYVVAEKVLGRGERLPGGWAIHGTTGYEFLNLVGGLFVDAAGARPMSAAYAAFTGQHAPFSDIVYEAKQLIVETAMASELGVLGHALSRLAQRHRTSRDFTRQSLTHVLREIIACFPLYRTYIAHGRSEVDLQDRACVEVAVAFARRRNPTTNASIFDFVRDILLLRAPAAADEDYRCAQLAFIGKFQQITAPVMAKGVEDTAFYRYNRLVSLNEVGGDPAQFGVSVKEFHKQCAARQQTWPAGLSATATHDTKRGEDARARIHTLSEIPRAWRDAARRWQRWNRQHAASVDGRTAPDANDEYLLYQTLLGVWPPGLRSPDGPFVKRLQDYMNKAAKEAKVHTSWVNPDEAYDGALRSFVAGILKPGRHNRFLKDFLAFQGSNARLGMVNSLAQTLLKITAPGVPDFYQGTEVWDWSLVDPDNRRPVDFALREAALAELRARIAVGDLEVLARELLEQWTDGRVKLYTIHRALTVRRASAALFQSGEHVALAADGQHAAHLCAFARRRDGEVAIVVVPRLTARLTDQGARLPLGRAVWGDTHIQVPGGDLPGPLIHAFTGARLPIERRNGALVLLVGGLLEAFPVALLTREEPRG
ncbi:MAG TPA: malto-oligosyltrehalose synthase [Longimicrobiales bacterium]|nr:malto-oligosyltrehalose synthase [Longimicrobiales bacterium]